MTVQIRKMTPSDLPRAMELLGLWNMAPRVGDPTAERSGIAIENTFVAQCDEEVMGVASYLVHSPEFAETASLAVDPACRGQGIGFRLQLARLEELQLRGIRRLRTEADRPETIEWYVAKFGYRIVGKSPKKHDFSLTEVDHWTVLELDVRSDRSPGSDTG